MADLTYEEKKELFMDKGLHINRVRKMLDMTDAKAIGILDDPNENFIEKTSAMDYLIKSIEKGWEKEAKAKKHPPEAYMGGRTELCQ